MSSEANQSSANQPIITEENTFIVKVKLLSNEVYEVSASPNATIPQLKVLVQAKTSVPVQKQRLVFMGKQLVDTAKVGDYIKESGLTIHLIARSQPQENTNTNPNSQPSTPQQPQPQPQNQQNQQQQPRPPMPPMINPFGGIFGFMGNPQGPQQSQQPQQGPNQPPNPFANNINSAVNNLIENLGIRIVPGPVSPPTQQQQPNIPQQPRPNLPQMNQFNIPPNQNRQPQPQPPQPAQQGAFRAIQQLQQSINRINYPSENLNAALAPRDRAIAYLRSLQNNMLRFMPQLNRGIQMLQQGRVTHLPQVAQILENMNQANSVAIELINRLSNQSQQTQHVHHNHGHNHHHHNHNHPHNHAHNHPSPNQEQRQPNVVNQVNVEGPNVTATLIISEEVDPNALNQAQNNSAPQQPNIMGLLNNFMSPGTGFNFANLFGGNVQPQGNQNSQPQPQAPQPQPQQSQPQSNPQQSQSPQSVPSNQQQQAPQNPLGALGGMNIMSMFNSLQQSGGMGTLLGMSLGGMLEQEGQPTTVYSAILAPITGSQVLACFTQKDFSFLNRKRDQFREATLRAISVAGSRQDLIKKYSADLEKMLAPPGTLRNEQNSRKKIKKILDRHIEKVICLFLESAPQANLNESVIGEIKLMYCEAIEQITKNSDSLEAVFGNIKQGFIQSVDHLIPGFSGLLYSMIERDMVRIYREYAQEKQRRLQMSEQEAKDEADLLRKIQEEAKNDSEEMASFEHSSSYPKSQKE